MTGPGRMTGQEPIVRGTDDRAARLAVGFVRVLAGAGVPNTVGSAVTFVEALAHTGMGTRAGVYWSGRATLVHRPEDIAIYDRVFAGYWEDQVGWSPSARPPAVVSRAFDDDHASPGEPDRDERDEGRPGETSVVRWSPAEVIRHRDFADLSDEEWRQTGPLLARMRTTDDLRRSRRQRRARRGTGRPDVPATLRRAMRTDGEVLRPVARRPSTRPRRLVLIADVSGSMEPYARAILRFAHTAVVARGPGRVEAFALGTRLTRLTRQLATRDPDVALRRAAATIVDLSGGTRLGDGLRTFNDEWGVRAVARGATVVIVSDGWDRGDPDRLGEEMARLWRVARRVIWVNPLKASPGYQPLARGMAAALPWIDQFVAGHSLAALEDLAALIGAAGPGPAPNRRYRATEDPTEIHVQEDLIRWS